MTIPILVELFVWGLALLKMVPGSYWDHLLLKLAEPLMAWSFLQRLCFFIETSVNVVFVLSLFLSVASPVLALICLWFRFEPFILGPYNTVLVRHATGLWNKIRFIASKGVLAWNVMSQWILRFSQAFRVRARHTGRDYVELDRVYFVQRSPAPTPSPTIATDNRIVDQPETIISHQEIPQYLRSRREGRLGSDSPDYGHLANRSTDEREAHDEARPTPAASPVALEQTTEQHHQEVAEPTNAASSSGIVFAISQVPAEPVAFVRPAPTRPSTSDRSRRLNQHMARVARERGETPEQLQARLDEVRALRTAQEAAPSTTAHTNQSPLPETDNTREQSVISRLFAPRTDRPRQPFRFRTRVVLVPPREPLFLVSSSQPRRTQTRQHQRNVPTPAPTPAPEPSAAPAPAPVLAVSRPVVTSTATPQPTVATAPSVSPEPTLAVQLTPPEIVITPPSPVLVPETPVEAVQDVIDEAISGLPDMLAPEAPVQEIVTVPFVPAALVVPQLHWVARDLTVTEQEMDAIRLQLEQWHISTPVAAFAAPAVIEQGAPGNAVQSPVSVPVLTIIPSPADDPVPSVAPSVEVSSSLEPVSASALDNDVEMEETLCVTGLQVSEPSSDGDLIMTENDAPPAVRVDQPEDHDMQDHAPEPSVFGAALGFLPSLASAPNFWELPTGFTSGPQAALNQFKFADLITPMPTAQTETLEVDMEEAPVAQASTPFFAFGQETTAPASTPSAQASTPFTFGQPQAVQFPFSFEGQGVSAPAPLFPFGQAQALSAPAPIFSAFFPLSSGQQQPAGTPSNCQAPSAMDVETDGETGSVPATASSEPSPLANVVFQPVDPALFQQFMVTAECTGPLTPQQPMAPQANPELEAQLIQAFQSYESDRDASAAQQASTETPENEDISAEVDEMARISEEERQRTLATLPAIQDQVKEDEEIDAQAMTDKRVEEDRLFCLKAQKRAQAQVEASKAEASEAEASEAEAGESEDDKPEDNGPDDDGPDDDQSPDYQAPPISQQTSQHTSAQPNVAPYADMGSVGEQSLPTGSAVPSTEQDAGDKHLTRLDRLLLSLEEDDDDVDDEVKDEDKRRAADAATMGRRKILPPKPRIVKRNSTNL